MALQRYWQALHALQGRGAKEMALQRHSQARHALNQKQLLGLLEGEPWQLQQLWQQAAKEAALPRCRPKYCRQRPPAKEMALQRRETLFLPSL